MPPKKDPNKAPKATAPAGPPALPAPPMGAFPPAQPPLPQQGQLPGFQPQGPGVPPGAPPQLPQLPGLAPAAPPQPPPAPQGQFIPQPDLQQLQQAAQTVSMQDVTNQAQQLQQLPPPPMPQMQARPPQGQPFDAVADAIPNLMLRLDQMSNMIATGFAELTNLLAAHNQQRQQEQQDGIARGQALYDGIVATQQAVLSLAGGGAAPQPSPQPQQQAAPQAPPAQPAVQDPMALLASINANFVQQADLVPWLAQQARTIASAGRYSVDQFPDYIFQQQPAFQQYFQRDDLFKFLKVMGFDQNGVIQA